MSDKSKVSKDIYEERYFSKERIEGKISEIKVKIAEREQEKKELIEKETKFNDLTVSLRLDSDNKKSRLNEITKQLKDEKDKKLDEIDFKLKENKEKIDTLRNNKKHSKKMWVIKEISIERLKEEKDDIELQIKNLEKETDELRVKKEMEKDERDTKFDDEKEKLSKEIEELEKKLKNVEIELDIDINSIRNKIESVVKKIKHYDEKILELKNKKTYPKEDAIKYNSLEIKPNGDNWNGITKRSNYTKIESYREKYEAYAKEHNLFRRYFSLVRLYEEYYKENKHPYSGIAMYKQSIEYDMIQDIITKITTLKLEDEMKRELRYLNRIKRDRDITPQTMLIARCNKHYLDYLDSKCLINLVCPVHKKCMFVKNGPLGDKCNKGCEMDATLRHHFYSSLSKNIENFTIEMKPDDIIEQYEITIYD